MQHSASSIFFQTPELRVRLSTFLTKKSIARLAKTCHRLRNSFVPLLWRDLELTVDKKVETSLQELMNLGRRAKFVSSLVISRGYLIMYINGLRDDASSDADPTAFLIGRPPWLPVPDSEYCLPAKFYPMNRLTRLECSLNGGPQDLYVARVAGVEIQYPPQELVQLCWLIQLNPGLTHVSLRSVYFRSSLDVRSLARAINSLDHLSRLRIDSIPSRDNWRHVYWTMFLCCSPSLESLVIEVGGVPKGFVPQLTPGPEDLDVMLGPLRLYSDTEPRPNLRHLVLPMSTMADMSLYFHILRLCPRLQRLDLELLGSRKKDIRAIGPWIQQHCPEVSTVRVRQEQRLHIEDVVLELLAGLNTSWSTLQRVHYEKFVEGEPRSMVNMVYQHHRTLRDVRLTDARTVYSAGIRALLTTCAGLERLEIVNDEGPTGRADIEDLVAQPWVCHGLRVLQMRVIWGDFEDRCPYYLQDPNTGLSPKDYARWVLLEKFYFQVGSMTKLEVLGLKAYLEVNIEDIPNHELYNGIEDDMRDKASFPQLMTLGNEATDRVGYLNYLCRLKNLRELRGSVHLVSEEIEETFRQREVEWVARHWPRLKVIELIQYQAAKPKRIKGNIHLNWLMKHLPGIDIRRPPTGYAMAGCTDSLQDHYDDYL
ncbi:hypothetical protein EC957_004553 [Mortierella hygrophila]|uniref:F-box domain-containing protein n=1 Tax=Mortierella hygrophila TaxID=979708 RepID=A0A9P6K6Y6_9FUNG|nr:hypothetical protein EC957_004553 [Mortierella hygrophila]